jgi:hypothetical protein
LRPANIGALIPRFPNRVIRDGIEPPALLRELEDVIINPKTKPDWGEKTLTRMFWRVAGIILEEARAPVFNLRRQPRGYGTLALHYRTSPKTKLLPIDVLWPCLLQEWPRNSTGFFLSLITRLLLDVEGDVTLPESFSIFLRAKSQITSVDEQNVIHSVMKWDQEARGPFKLGVWAEFSRGSVLANFRFAPDTAIETRNLPCYLIGKTITGSAILHWLTSNRREQGDLPEIQK